jgi:Leucine-rich repeat (LRR) protein
MKKILYYALMISMLATAGCSKDEVHDPDEDIIIDFPDANFKHYLLTTRSGFNDRNKDGEISVAEAKRITYIECYTDNIYTLEGIQYLPNLETLKCPGPRQDFGQGEGQLTLLDVSKNTKLTLIDCSDNYLELLDVSNNTALEKLNCSYNLLTSLDLSNNINLIELNTGNNNANGGLVSLDLSNNVKLKGLNCSLATKLTNIDISKCLSLEYLNLSNCNLQYLDLSVHTKLVHVDCWMTSLVTLVLIYGHDYDYLYYNTDRTNAIYVDI